MSPLHHSHPSNAFTLVELLIVVAIVSILASIAVPNFLEAQVRAKVARSTGNLRVLAMGIEAYAVDGGSYPPDSSYLLTFIERVTRLTSPVAYLADVPADPFAIESQIDAFLAGNPQNPWKIGGHYVYPLTYDFAKKLGPDGWEPVSVWECISSHPDAVEWGLRGIGPDLKPQYLGIAWPAYDPTNGSISHGHLYWTGPGMGPDVPLRSESER